MIEREGKIHVRRHSQEMAPAKAASPEKQVEYLNKLLHIQTQKIEEATSVIEALKKEVDWCNTRLYSKRLWQRIRRLFG